MRKRSFIFIFVLCPWSIRFFQNHMTHSVLLDRRSIPVKEPPIGWKYNTSFPVDLVYTWVNGSDQRLRTVVEKLKNNLRRTKSFSATKANNLGYGRFADNGALKFSLRSLEKYANWIRHVFIVTNGQIPNWLNLQNPRVTIVKHKEIFDAPEYLPTFSSRAIEHNIHKIKGLSERFINMNDDFFFGRNVSLEDFYTEDKGTKVYLAWDAPTHCSTKCTMKMIKNGICDDVCNYDHCSWDGGDCDNSPIRQRPRDPDIVHCDYAGAIFFTNAIYSRKFGYKERKVIAHSPLFMEKSIKQDLDERFPNEVNATINRKLRSTLDFQFEFSYMYFLMEAYNHSKRFELKVNSPDVAFITPTINLQETRMYLDMLRRTKRKFVCINDNIDYNYPIAAMKTNDLVEKFYESKFPSPSSFEIHN